MGRSEELNMGFHILGHQYLVNYSFWVIYITDDSKEKNGTPKG
jgi:hypothetical protein